MNAVLIPVRSMNGAKNRLAAELDEAARTRLTLAMLADMITAARAARHVDRVYVVSSDRALLERAQRYGAEPIHERADGHADAQRARGGLNRAVFAAACLLERTGVRRLLTIPGDVPLITPEEVDDVFMVATDVVLAPSAAGTGTNGLLTAPPCALVPQFEGESLAAHARACDTAGLRHAVRPLAGFALDIDTVEDVRTLAACGAERSSARVAAALLATIRSEAPAAVASDVHPLAGPH